MSRAQIYAFKENEVFLKAEFQNSFLGAALLWRNLEEKYLPPNIPDYAKGTPFEKHMTRMINGNMKEVWNLFNDENVSYDDRVSLGCTFDKVVILRKDFDKICNAFRKQEGHFPKMAEIIKSLDSDIKGIAFNHTSVCCFFLSEAGGEYDEESDKLFYDLDSGDSHQFIFTKDGELNIN